MGGLRPQGGLRPNKIVEEGGVCAMVIASPSFVFSKNGLPPLRPPYVCEHPSPATADRSLALGPFEEQPHQLFGIGNRLHGTAVQTVSYMNRSLDSFTSKQLFRQDMVRMA